MARTCYRVFKVYEGTVRCVRMTQNRAARLGGGLFVISGNLTLANNYLPGSEALNLKLLTAVGAGAVGIGIATWLLIPWHRMWERATLLLPLLALALVGVAVSEGGVTGQTFSVFFVLIAAYVGATQPRWTMLWMSVPMSAVYVYAASGRVDSTSAQIWSVTVVIPACILVGEVLAGALEAARIKETQSARRQELLAVVAHSSRSVSSLDTNQVLSAVADAAVKLGYEGVAIEVFGPTEDTYRCAEARGLPAAFSGSVHTTDLGIIGEIMRSKAQLLVNDYAADPRAHPKLADAGFKVVVGTPIWSGTHMVAVLSAGTRREIELESAELEALELLADQAGRALDLAQVFERERKAAQRYRLAALNLGSQRDVDEFVELETQVQD